MELCFLGVMFYSDFISLFRFSIFLMFLGGFGFFRCVSRWLIWCSLLMLLVFMFRVIWWGVLKRFVNIGIFFLLICLKRSVGFFVWRVWLVILVIFRCDDIGCEICLSLFFCCNWEIKLCKLVYFIFFNKFFFVL